MGLAMILLGTYMLGRSLNIETSAILAGIGGLFAILGGLLALYEPAVRLYSDLQKPPREPFYVGFDVTPGHCRRCGQKVEADERYCAECAQLLERISHL
jgi:hypothetical protein